MAESEGKYFQAPVDGVDHRPTSSTRRLKVAFTLVGGGCLVLFSIMVMPSMLQRARVDEATSLAGVSSIRSPQVAANPVPPQWIGSGSVFKSHAASTGVAAKGMALPRASASGGPIAGLGGVPSLGLRGRDSVIAHAPPVVTPQKGDDAPPAGEEYELDQPKPLGITWIRCADGGIYAKAVSRQADSRVSVGDKLVAISASFGSEVWPADNYGQSMYAIRTRVGNVYCKILARGGDTDIFEVVEDETQAKFRMERNGGNYGAGTKEKQQQNYATTRETAREREKAFYMALDEFKARKYEQAVIDFENVRAAEPAGYMSDTFERVTPVFKVSSYNIACCYSQLNQQEAGMQALKEALDAGFDDYKLIRSDPNLACVREAPKFKALMDMYDEPIFDTDALNIVKNLFR